MLDKIVFTKALAYIGNVYVDWKFDLNDIQKIDIWYSFFANFDDIEFKTLIKQYCFTKEFAPISPASILNFYKEIKNENELLPHAAWEMVIDLIHEHGFDESGRDKVYNELLKYPVLRKTVWEFENTLKGLKMGDTFTPQRFQEAYKENLKRETNQKQREQFLKLNTSNQNNLIEKGGK